MLHINFNATEVFCLYFATYKTHVYIVDEIIKFKIFNELFMIVRKCKNKTLTHVILLSPRSLI